MTLKVDGTNGVLQAYDYQVPTTGFTYTFAAGTQTLVMNPAGTLATGTITLPASPADGMNITITSTQIITALTINGNTGQTVVGGATSLKAGGAQVFIYRLSNTTWYNQNNNTSVGYVGPNSQVFAASGTFTIPAGITSVKVTVVGGGGGGGGGDPSFPGTGAGGGGAAIKWLTGLTPGGTLTVTRGAGGAGGGNNANGSAGGTSSVASGTQTISTVSATGGGGGPAGSGTAGSGGAGSGGDLNITGGGGNKCISDNAGTQSGAGGSSILGGGGSSRGSTPSSAGGAYGGGAGGAYTNAGTGGAGANGVIVFEW